MKNNKVMNKQETKLSDEWRTPPEVFSYLNNIFKFTIDGCANDENHLCDRYYTKDNSFLDVNVESHDFKTDLIGENIYINPPYSNPLAFVQHAIALTNLNCLSVMLLNTDNSTKWFDLIKEHATEVWFITGSRLSFLMPDGSTRSKARNPSMIAVFNPRDRKYNNPTTKYIDVSEFK